MIIIVSSGFIVGRLRRRVCILHIINVENFPFISPRTAAPPTYNLAGNETSPLQVQPAGVEFPELDDTTFACNCCPIVQKLPNLQLPPQVITFRKRTEN